MHPFRKQPNNRYSSPIRRSKRDPLILRISYSISFQYPFHPRIPRFPPRRNSLCVPLNAGFEGNVTAPIVDDSSGVCRGTDTSAEPTHYSKTVKNFTGAPENETNPLDVDMDDDGLSDCWIDGWMWDWYLKSWLQDISKED
ncbi:MAG: hypothetical protein ACE5QW_07980 [Thermoplasmata archaeon]